MKGLLLLLAFLVLRAGPASACTSAVISGKATPDGRPLLWKQRDTGTLENKLVYAAGERYRFLGVHDLTDTLNAECFMGSNETGFSIMNTASYNLVYEKYAGKMDEEGVLMRRALATCRTLADFERLLEETRGSRGVEANFGVIDAEGGAAYYETDPFSFRKFDANDSLSAPHGYIIRTNFSMAGKPEQGQGYIRYQNTASLFQWAYLGGKLSVDGILLDATANMRHSLTGIDLLQEPLPHSADVVRMVNFADFVPRYSTSASLLVQGVRPGEDPAGTVLWLMLGSPLTTPVVPVWVKHAGAAPEMLFAKENTPARLNALSLALKGRCFPLKTPEGRYYLDLAKVANAEGTGTLQALKPVHRTVLTTTRTLLAGSAGVPEEKPLREFYRAVERLVTDFYGRFGVR